MFVEDGSCKTKPADAAGGTGDDIDGADPIVIAGCRDSADDVRTSPGTIRQLGRRGEDERSNSETSGEARGAIGLPVRAQFFATG